MKPQRIKQITSQELLDDLLRFVGQKFYPDDPRAFAQDKSRLLSWVILWPASWFNKRGVSVPGNRYKQIFTEILLQAVRLGNTSRIQYRPAWLKMVVQSHFAMHGEEYYGEAKSARALAENALLMVGKAAGRAPDPVEDLVSAHRLLITSKPKRKTVLKKVVNLELKLS